MNSLAAHTHHFEKQMARLYKSFSRFIIPSRMFENLEIPPQTFSFAGYQTKYYYKDNGILFYTRPIDIAIKTDTCDAGSNCRCEPIPMFDPDENEWLLIDKKIEEFAIKRKI